MSNSKNGDVLIALKYPLSGEVILGSQVSPYDFIKVHIFSLEAVLLRIRPGMKQRVSTVVIHRLLSLGQGQRRSYKLVIALLYKFENRRFRLVLVLIFCIYFLYVSFSSQYDNDEFGFLSENLVLKLPTYQLILFSDNNLLWNILILFFETILYFIFLLFCFINLFKSDNWSSVVH